MELKAYPKNAIAQDQMIAFDQLTITGGDPSSSGSSKDSAGRIPTKPAARGIFRQAKSVNEEVFFLNEYR